ncbi:MAG: ComF family protein [Rickettsiales bacterium]|nr:ComF family protein [Rickettsiales bacterium]
MKLITTLKNVIFPNSCVNCNKIINPQSFFCLSCWSKLQFITNPKCQICSYPLEFENLHSICAKCSKTKPKFDQNISIFRYNYTIKAVIKKLKYQDKQYLAKKLANILIKNSNLDFQNFDIITCTPTHKKQLMKRKFNPPALLAKNICRLTKHNNFYPNLLIKVINTKPQTKLTRSQRQKNLSKAFTTNPTLNHLIKNKSILLVDDVTTTNATLNELSKTLRKQNPKKITTLTIAKTF